MVAYWGSVVEFGKLEREIRIDAAPEIVFDVVSRPEHIKMWWPDDASFEPAPGAVGELVFGAHAAVEPITVVDVDPPRRFAFHWIAPNGQLPDADNSLLVTFELEPSGDGTILRLTESGWREKGWEAAVLEEAFHDHERGWDMFLPRLQSYAPSVVAR
ncbi:SRPBCC domain-containing protein [Planotetraspora phitsanulokensis]|uniref:Activator of HSP90 ATPase n=1 Tax=Planotetraspora phitsanulokensis TaxID=575192 RepID=A0A8J3U4R8_9ACTN|nr:activator of HSP90 ATPase [Planotetraspora phitsanulokensis]